MRFVIQHHTNKHDHYDLMIERENNLLTWQINPEDFFALLQGRRIEAIKIQDHRKVYLTYEGEISGNRGSVKIFDSGEYESRYDSIKTFDESRYILLHFYGRVVKGTIQIHYIGENIFRIEYSTDFL